VAQKPGWAILECDMGWYHLYKYWLRSNLPREWRMVVDADRAYAGVDNRKFKIEPKLALVGRVDPPAWGPHISIIRGERLPDSRAWRRYDGTVVRFSYNPELRYNDNHFWLDVQCNQLLDLREELGLRREPRVQLHLTMAVWALPVPRYVDGDRKVM